MPHTSNKKKAKQPSADEGSRPPRDSRHDVDEPDRPRYVNPIFPQGTDRSNQPLALAASQSYSIVSNNHSSGEPASTTRPLEYEVNSSSSLSATGRRFARDVELRDIAGCAQYFNDYPEVLTEQDTDRKYTREAVAALRLGDIEGRDLADSLVEKCLLIKACAGKTNRQITEYLQPLASRNKSAWRDFYEDFDLIMGKLKAQVKASATTRAPTTNPSTSDRHDSSIEKVTKGFSELDTGSGPTYGGPTYGAPIYTTYSGQGGTGFNSKNQPTESRHDNLPSQTPVYDANPPPNRQERPGPRQTQRRPSEAADTQIKRPVVSDPRHGLRTEEALEETRSQASEYSRGSLIPSLRGNAGPRLLEMEKRLDPRFLKRSPKAAGSLFVIGRVFAILWHTERTSGADDVSQAKWVTSTSMGAEVFSHIRRFVVVKEGHGFCRAVPINTYRGQGARKSGFNAADIDAHAIIHMQGERGFPLNNEPLMSKRPIKVVPADRECELEKASRVNFGRVHTVE